MKHALSSLAAVGLAAALVPACQGDFSHLGAAKHLVVNVTSNDLGTPDARLPLSVIKTTSFTLHIEAQLPDGTIDTSFNGFVRVTSVPGTVADLNVRNVQLHNGVIDGVVVPVVGAYGNTNLWVEDDGYEPADPAGTPPPQCSDGIDNNGNGLIDYPADPGCYSPIDNTEDLGTYAAGISQTLYFERPRIAFVRGYNPSEGGLGNATSFPHQQVDIDTGWRGGTSYAFSTIVVGVSGTGFYAQDLQDDLNPAPGYGGVYAYNFSAPPFMRICDRLQVFGGETSDFYGETEVNYPTWQLEYWDPSQRDCMVPEPAVLGIGDINSANRLWSLESSLARVLTNGTVSVHVAKHFGPGFVPLVNGAYVPGPDNTNCDFNGNGKVDFSTDPAETACGDACDGSSAAAPTDFECSEWSAYASNSDFELIVQDSSSGTQTRIQGNASSATTFDPPQFKGQTIKSFTGIVSYFSGGSAFTIQARCDDDIIADPNGQPLTSNVACVHPRTALDNQQFAQ